MAWFECTGGSSGGVVDPIERLCYAKYYWNDNITIPTINTLDTGAKYSQYISYDSTTRKFTVLQPFDAIITAWVYNEQSAGGGPNGCFYINDIQKLNYTAGRGAGDKAGGLLFYNFVQGDIFYPYTTSRNGYPQQNFKIYLAPGVQQYMISYSDEEAST